MSDSTLHNRLKEFLENEGKSCSFDPELITPEYVFRKWGGNSRLRKSRMDLRNYGIKEAMSDN